MVTLDELNALIDRVGKRASGSGSDADEAYLVVEALQEFRSLRQSYLRHPAASEGLLRTMQPWARQIASRFGRPVYLCGSALELPQPRDIDVRVVLTDAEFAARWGNPNTWRCAVWTPYPCEGSRRWASDMGKLNQQGSKVLGLNLDLQVQALCHAREFADKPRLRLDDVLDLEDATEEEAS